MSPVTAMDCPNPRGVSIAAATPSTAMNAGSEASAMTPSAGSGLFLRIWSNSSIFSRCIVAFLLLDLFVVLNNATCYVRARAFGASFLLVPDLLMYMLAPLAAYFNANRTNLQNSMQIENGWQIAISVHSSHH